MSDHFIDLAGQWKFRRDDADQGLFEKWFLSILPNSTPLPGSLNATVHSDINTESTLEHLSSKRVYIGPAWYQRTVDIPEQTEGKPIVISLERCHWETMLWVDDKSYGLRNSLSCTHTYQILDGLSPGTHTITIRVDNRIKLAIGNNAHAITAQTQTNWNGVIGELRLIIQDRVRIRSCQLFPDQEQRLLTCSLVIDSLERRTVSGSVCVKLIGHDNHIQRVDKKIMMPSGISRVSVELDAGKSVTTWDEFTPTVYQVETIIKASTDSGEIESAVLQPVGFRSLRASGKRFLLNERPIFLRGTLECCIFPLTGYPPTDVEPWLRIFEIARSYGLNHLRFHSYCPPRAAFVAADQTGFYLQVEIPAWVESGIGGDDARDAFLRDELLRILDEYGNHPSFCLLSMGNEESGDHLFLSELVKMAKAKDARHLYCLTSFTFDRDCFIPSEGDYVVTQQDHNQPMRNQWHINKNTPSTNADFRAAISGFDRPIITHEIGQYTVFPHMDEIDKYTGLLYPTNLILIRDSLRKSGLLDQSAEFSRASGRWAAELYKEEIEAALRTDGLAGFALLDLHDFPGQGTALVGILDAFWDSKGAVSAAEHSRYCGSTVPLLRITKRVWKYTEAISATVEAAHFGPLDLVVERPTWSITTVGGQEVAQGDFESVLIQTGCVSQIGEFTAHLDSRLVPERLIVSVRLGPEIENSWSIWRYPDDDSFDSTTTSIVTKWSAETTEFVSSGGKVLYLPNIEKHPLAHPIDFATAFWSPIWFKNQPGTMGIYCDPTHPALADFPTEFHSNWQWHELTHDAYAISGLPSDVGTIIRVIDGYHRNASLALVFEANVGRGMVIVSCADLCSDLDNRIVARRLRNSLLKYMLSDNFKPVSSMTLDEISAIESEQIVESEQS